MYLSPFLDPHCTREIARYLQFFSNGQLCSLTTPVLKMGLFQKDEMASVHPLFTGKHYNYTINSTVMSAHPVDAVI